MEYSGKNHFLPPATKLGQGNIFRSMCQELCPRGGGGHVWWWGACVAGGGMCGWGVHGSGVCVAGGHVWWGGHAWQILRDMVNEQAVRILLQCILVTRMHCSKMRTTRLLTVSHSIPCISGGKSAQPSPECRLLKRKPLPPGGRSPST